jgi:hypothetical protein
MPRIISPIHEGTGRRTGDVELDAARPLLDLDIKA